MINVLLVDKPPLVKGVPRIVDNDFFVCQSSPRCDTPHDKKAESKTTIHYQRPVL